MPSLVTPQRIFKNVFLNFHSQTKEAIILKFLPQITIKGGSRRAGKSRKVLMMMKAAKLG